MARRALAVLLLVALPLAAWAHSYVGTGTVTVGKDRMKVQSAIAVWSPEGNRLTISLFPFRLTREQLAALDRYPADYTVADDPEPKPFFRVDVEFRPGSKGPYAPGDVKFSNFTAWRMGKEGGSLSAQAGKMQGEFTLSGDFRNLRGIMMSARGEEDFGMSGTRMTWNVEARCRVYRQKQAPQ